MSQEISIVEKIQAPIVEYKKSFENQLLDFEKKYKGIVFDMNDAEKRAEARKARTDINTKFIKPLDEAHKNIKEPILEATKLIDSTRKEIKDKAETLVKGITDQLKSYDDMIQKKLDSISSLSHIDSEKSSADITLIINSCQNIVIDDSFGEKKPDAALLKEQTLAELRLLHQKALDKEELLRLKKAEEERLRIQREENIRKEAEEKAALAAKFAAEQAERDKIEAVKKAEAEAQAKIDAANKAQAAAEQAAQDAAKRERERIEAAALQAKREAEEAAAIEEKKKANQAHRAKIHREAADSLTDNGVKDAEKIITLIKDGLIKHVSISY